MQKGLFMQISLPRYWLTRLYLACSVLNVTLVSCFESRTLLYRIIQQSDDAGWWCVLGLACLACLGVVDTLINDLLPKNFNLRCAKKYRHLIYMALAMGMLSLAYIIAKAEGASYLLIRPCLDAAVAACIAFFDLFARHRPGAHA